MSNAVALYKKYITYRISHGLWMDLIFILVFSIPEHWCWMKIISNHKPWEILFITYFNLILTIHPVLVVFCHANGQTGPWVIDLLIEFRIKMRPHRLIYNINNPILTLYFRFEFFIRKLDKSLCTSLIIRLTCILMIDTHKNVIRY